MKYKISAVAIAMGMILPVMSMHGERTSYQDSQSGKIIRIYPEADISDTLDKITVTTEHPAGFGSFVYMPSLYSMNEDGSIGAEVSACQLIDGSVRGKNTLEFKVINPPTRPGKYTLLIKDNSFSINPDVQTEAPGRSSSDENTIPDSRIISRTADSNFRNFPVNLESDTLRILHISNSYGGNLLGYIKDILKAANVDVSKILIERLVYSGGSFMNWVEVNNDNNPDMYSYYKEAGDLNTNMDGLEGGEKDGSKFRKLLEENQWDLIVLNQASQYAPYYEEWDSNGPGGWLPELLSVIRNYQPKVPIGFLLIHSWAENHNRNTEHWSSTQRWENIKDGAMWLGSTYDIDFIIPYGTAIQNLRLSEYNNTSELTRDGTHLASGLAQYTAGCCYFETVLSPRYKKSIWGNSFRINDVDNNKVGMIPINDESAEIAQKAAFLATHNMFELRNPNLADLTDYRYGEALNQEEYSITFQLTGSSIQSIQSAQTYCVYGPSGILINKMSTEEEWTNLPAGLYIVRQGTKTRKIAVK